MTKRREPLTAEQTLMTIVAKIGWPEAEAIAGRAERTMRHWSDPDITTCVSIDAAEKLDRAFIAAGGDFAPFLALYQTKLELDLTELWAANGCRLERTANAARENGEAIAAAIRADGPAATLEDKIVARRELEESIAAQASKLAEVRADIDRAQAAGARA